MITMLKKTREKIHLTKTQERGTKVRNTQQSEASNVGWWNSSGLFL